MKKLVFKILSVLLVLTLALWLALSYSRADALVGKAVRGTASDAVTGSAKVYANADIKVKTEVEGRIAEIPVDLGKAVKKGDAIMVLASDELNGEIRANVVQLKAAREKLRLPLPEETDLANLQDQLDRLKKQVEFGQASKADLEKGQRDLDKLQTTIAYRKIERDEQAALFEATVARLQARLARMTVKCPMDGTVIEQYKWPGDYVWTGNEIFRVASTGRWIELTLAEEDCAGVEAGQKAVVRLASYPDTTFNGTVTGLAAFSNSDNKTRAVFLSVDAPDAVLVPGLTGEGVLTRSEHANSVLVPRRALFGDRVYVVKNGRIDIRKVKTGFVGLDAAEIVSGVTAGETVVLEGQRALRRGEKGNAVTEGAE